MGRPEKTIDMELLHKILINQRDRLEAMESIDAADVANELSSVIARLPVDLVAAVRDEVESGTIEGEVVLLDGASVGEDVPDDLIELVFYMERSKGVEWFRRNSDFLVIPVSDGGEDA